MITRPSGGGKVTRLACLLLLAGHTLRPEKPQTRSSVVRVPSLDLPAAQAEALTEKLERKDLIGAEQVLLAAAGKDARSAHAARIYAFLGGICYENQDYWNAAIAWNKSDAVTPLDPALRFTLAMAYVRLGRRDWARRTLTQLEKQDEHQVLYPYWLGRLAYDGQQYDRAIALFTRALRIDPSFAKAHDNLGLCFFYLNQNERAITEYREAIALDKSSGRPSPWPYLNLAEVLSFTGSLDPAIAALQQAITLDPSLALARFQLGVALEQKGDLAAAAQQQEMAAELNSTYAEPHVALARIYRRLGNSVASQREVELYRRLKAAATTTPVEGVAVDPR